MITTLALCHQQGACNQDGPPKDGGYNKLKANLGDGWSDNAPIDLLTVLESNGLDDCIWALRAVPKELEAERDRIARTFACDCAERVLPIFEKEFPDDGRPRKAIEVARRFTDGEATVEELSAAGSAAESAARSAAESAARSAAGSAAWSAAESAAGSAARLAAWSAAESAARLAVWSAARSAARSAAEKNWQAERLRELLS